MESQRDDTDFSLLKRRAMALSRPREMDSAAAATVPLLEFRMMGARYAVDLGKVEAVMRIGDVFSIPHTPKHIPGVIRRRGETIAIVNLKHFFHPENEGLVDMDFAVIVFAHKKRFALQVEEIEGVSHIETSRLKQPPDNFDKAQAPYLSGVTIDGLAILDMDKLVEVEGFGTHSKLGNV